MRAISVNPQTQEVNEIDIHLEANTVYTFFNSILIDELATLNEHVIYANAEALSQNKKAYFIGDQLIVGDALILGRSSFEDIEASVPVDALKSLVKYEVNEFYSDVLEALSSTDINLYRTFEVEADGQKLELNTEWVLYTFNLADDKTKDYFLTELKKDVAGKSDVAEFMNRMASLAIRSGAAA
jgi:hypothetical protein